MSEFISLNDAIKLSFEGFQEEIESIVDFPVELSHMGTGSDASWHLRRVSPVETVASFDFRPSLQCSGIAVPYHSKVDTHWRGKGIASVLHEMRIDAAKRASMKLMVATTRLNNAPQDHIMHKYGWKQVSVFDNPRSGHAVVLWVKEL